ncbi:MAG: TolC family protein [Planctomycetes bacterium]|jgi:outer membrane protein TolC|nr:TolC family protein [Planctomycetota bacterium]
MSRTLLAVCGLTLLARCTATPIEAELSARRDLETVTTRYRPGDSKPELPALSPDSPLSDWLRYAMLNDPRVEAAYYDWAASVERISAARSLPDPRLTFSADITSVIAMVMPGLMIDLPGPGKLRAAGEAAAAESRAGYFAFEAQVLRTAFSAKSAYHRLRFLEDSILVRREMLALLGELEESARQQVTAGRGTIQDVLRAQIERRTLATRLDSLEDSRGALHAEFRASLGHDPADKAVPLPTKFDSGAESPPPDGILSLAASRNPELRRLEAEVRRGEAMLDLAFLSGVPDLSAGIEADVRASPVLWRPTASLTLPIWRDKVAAGIAAAQAGIRSAEARLTAAQIGLAAEVAAMIVMVRESTRNEALFGTMLRPMARQALEAARAGYAAGRSSFLDVVDAERQWLEFELSHIEARTQRELALASLSLTISGVAPEGSPVLPPPVHSGVPTPQTEARR